jgi:hypothetical protein
MGRECAGNNDTFFFRRLEFFEQCFPILGRKFRAFFNQFGEIMRVVGQQGLRSAGFRTGFDKGVFKTFFVEQALNRRAVIAASKAEERGSAPSIFRTRAALVALPPTESITERTRLTAPGFRLLSSSVRCSAGNIPQQSIFMGGE